MEKSVKSDLLISEKLKRIISKYYTIEIFKDVVYSFTPKCIIKIEESKPESHFKQMQDELKQIGFQIKFYPLSVKEYKSFNISEPYEKEKYYNAIFIPKEISISIEKRKRNTKIQVSLAIITSFMVILSGIFYVTFIEPYYGPLFQSEFEAYLAIFFFCLGMLAIVVIHEFGHVIMSRHHKIECSYPFLIPGPPPIGMFGAFVSIRDDPQTRNQQFDIAIGGILFNLIIAMVLLIIGFQFSEFIDTETYISLRMIQSNRTYVEAAEFIRDGLNQYNLLFLGLRNIFFPIPSYGYYSGIYLPDQILILHPLAYAGWIGLILSGLNLIPISFFDGGHTLKAIFPTRYIRLIGLIIGTVLLLSLDWDLYFIAFLAFPGVCFELNTKSKSYKIPNPTIKLKKSRKIFAFSLVFIFIILYPLTFDNLIFGFGI